MDLIIILGILIIPTIAQIYITTTYSKYRTVNNKMNISGQEVARKVLDENSLEKIYVVSISGNLSDHYDSSRKVVRLSSDIFNNNSVASAAVAAHECGHAIQDKDGYFFMRLRSFIYPIVKVGTTLSYILIAIGLFAQILDVMYIGIAIISLGLIFQLVTLPVEFDASKRALEELEKLNLVTSEDKDGARRMLTAAAFTYVAGVLTSILQILRLLAASNRNQRR